MTYEARILLTIFLFVLTFPFGLKLDVILEGEYTEAEVLYHRNISKSKSIYNYTLLEFRSDNSIISFYGPQNIIYNMEKTFKVAYDKNNPKRFIMFEPFYLYFAGYMIIPVFILFLFTVYYFSTKNY